MFIYNNTEHLNNCVASLLHSHHGVVNLCTLSETVFQSSSLSQLPPWHTGHEVELVVKNKVKNIFYQDIFVAKLLSLFGKAWESKLWQTCAGKFSWNWCCYLTDCRVEGIFCWRWVDTCWGNRWSCGVGHFWFCFQKRWNYVSVLRQFSLTRMFLNIELILWMHSMRNSSQF